MEKKIINYLKVFGIKLSMLLPNFIIVISASLLLYAILGTLSEIITPGFGYSKSYKYDEYSDIILLMTIIISLIYLFVKTDKKYFFMLKSAIIINLILTAMIYFVGQLGYSAQQKINKVYHDSEQIQSWSNGLKAMEENAKQQGYSDLGEYLEDFEVKNDFIKNIEN